MVLSCPLSGSSSGLFFPVSLSINPPTVPVPLFSRRFGTAYSASAVTSHQPFLSAILLQGVEIFFWHTNLSFCSQHLISNEHVRGAQRPNVHSTPDINIKLLSPLRQPSVGGLFYFFYSVGGAVRLYTECLVVWPGWEAMTMMTATRTVHAAETTTA